MLQLTVNEKNIYSISGEDAQVVINGNPVDCDVHWQPNGLISVLHNGRSFTAMVEQTDADKKEITLRVNGQLYRVGVKEPIDLLLADMGLDMKAMHKAEPVKAPMPGMVLRILVSVGQEISKGDGLVVLEAMKMENILKATAPGKVKAIKVNERTAVDKGTVLIDME